MALYKNIRNNVSGEFHIIYQQSERMQATAVGEIPSKHRSCARHRSNAEAESVEDWYRINVAVPFLGHIINELVSQFSTLPQTASKLLRLIPAVFVLLTILVAVGLNCACIFNLFKHDTGLNFL